MAKGTFDYDKVHETLQTLETYYEDFYRAIQAMDEAVAKVIDVGDDSAILGTRAATGLLVVIYIKLLIIICLELGVEQ